MQVLLSTAIAKVYNDFNGFIWVICLVDQGSQFSFITESLCQRLRLNYSSVNLSISEIGVNKSFTCKKLAHIVLTPRFDSDFSSNIKL